MTCAVLWPSLVPTLTFPVVIVALHVPTPIILTSTDCDRALPGAHASALIFVVMWPCMCPH